MFLYGSVFAFAFVALRKESVDRNTKGFKPYRSTAVALRKESVDRNTLQLDTATGKVCRSPQGERG